MVWSSWIVALAAIGGAVRLRQQGTKLWPLFAFFAIVALGVATTFGQLRYRASAEIPLVLLAAVALEWLWERVRSRTGPPGSRAAPNGSDTGAMTEVAAP